MLTVPAVTQRQRGRKRMWLPLLISTIGLLSSLSHITSNKFVFASASSSATSEFDDVPMPPQAQDEAATARRPYRPSEGGGSDGAAVANAAAGAGRLDQKQHKLHIQYCTS
jgi:hypothetical protein